MWYNISQTLKTEISSENDLKPFWEVIKCHLSTYFSRWLWLIGLRLNLSQFVYLSVIRDADWPILVVIINLLKVTWSVTSPAESRIDKIHKQCDSWLMYIQVLSIIWNSMWYIDPFSVIWSASGLYYLLNSSTMKFVTSIEIIIAILFTHYNAYPRTFYHGIPCDLLYCVLWIKPNLIVIWSIYTYINSIPLNSSKTCHLHWKSFTHYRRQFEFRSYESSQHANQRTNHVLV